ncbi:YdeI/OmpD-associated family protein [Flavilitoribacter nigricans]|uniref:YdhG-like domain-containing protein n=1 Tax=Flavilitoribacter nigricans (strain ATCC 23147 / DSM 23189 / NBRC 102662 / NCIMB 1420 / SS-2) TaxID=1122177 RepID=A0A2D0NET4_FLAN2|nr:YdeI/OmpD-associated family protein [Flavilitoribacter nigricans]PHN07021.1 hypothetical protein CRP01_08660 [Flavilitoribacter nigricans DSM 23189 = NBRC 102662]
MNPKVDLYFEEGCGRCPLGGTPDCKVHNWTEEMAELRAIILDCGLDEEVKWSVPCYTFQGNNILILSAFKEYCCISFFKGALLQDAQGLLDKPGANTQAARLLRFTNLEEVSALKSTVEAYIYEAIEIEKAGLQVNFKKESEPIPEELQAKLEEDPVLKTAFEALTPGRQRGYLLYFLAPKQSKTRTSRVEKYIPQILAGKGMHDR